jgi:fido (protein-threonine AMPylation protein)
MEEEISLIEEEEEVENKIEEEEEEEINKTKLKEENNFHKIEEKNINNKINKISWSTTMDLFAMINNDTQISIHRPNYQKLYTITLNKEITTICWNKNGKIFCVGKKKKK